MFKTIKKRRAGFTQHHFSAISGAGFTLIETIVYIALLGLMMSGTVTAVYQILRGSSIINTKTTVQNEGSFVLRKINWAFTAVDPTKPITISAGALSLTKYDLTSVDIRLNGTKIEMRENGGTFLPITTDNVQVMSLQFQKTVTDPIGISAATTIKTIDTSALDFATTKYLRK